MHLIGGLFALLGELFWLWMLIDCITSQRPQDQKLMWVVVIVFTNFVGAVLYFFLRDSTASHDR